MLLSLIKAIEVLTTPKVKNDSSFDNFTNLTVEKNKNLRILLLWNWVLLT